MSVDPTMWRIFGVLVSAALLLGSAASADAAPVPSARGLEAGPASGLTRDISYRRGAWRYASPCRPGGRYYRYGGGWGCDYYLYGLWPVRPPRRW